MKKIKLREYQKESVKKCVDALQGKNNTLFVAPTGSGKTVVLCEVLKRLFKKEKVEWKK